MIYFILFFFELGVLFLLSKKVQKNVAAFFYGITKSKKLTIYLMALLFLPGTFIHEIAHFLTALFLLVPVGNLELIPEFQGYSVKMGSVSIGKTDMVRRFLIGVAPFIFGTALILGGLSYLAKNNLLKNPYYILLVAYFAFTIGNTMFASKKDLEGALQLFIFVIFLFVLLYLLGVNFSVIDINKLLSNELILIIRKANIFLTAPILIDSLVIFLLNPKNL